MTTEKQDPHQSFSETLRRNDQIRQKIDGLPYGLPLYILLAQEYSHLAYPDLATGAAYKALLLADAIQDEDDDLHEQAVEGLANLLSNLSSDVERQFLESTNSDIRILDDEEESSANFNILVRTHYLPTIYEILVNSLLECGCYRSAFTYCSQALKLFPANPKYENMLASIRESVAKRLNVEINAVVSGEESNSSSWPDSGFVRREQYQWNTFEPARLEELTTLNEMMSDVAPKLEVLAVDLLDLTAQSPNGSPNYVRQLGVFAKEDILPGEIILTETSMLTANNKLQDALCDACSADLPSLGTAEASNVVSCPDCNVVFCGDDCMDRAMQLYHPALCERDVEGIAKDVPAKDAADALYSLLLLRCLAMAETQQCHPLELKEVKFIWGDFDQRQISNFTEAQQAPKSLPFSFEHNVRLPFHMLEKMDIDVFANPQYDVWIFNTLYSKFRGTASARLSGAGGRQARGPEVSAVHPMWCLANHSCDPNVTWDWGGSIHFWARERRIPWKSTSGEEVKAKKPGIKKGEEILNHYCDIELPVDDRRAWAKGALGGFCRCERCIWEAGEG